MASIPTCFAIPILFAFSSITALPSIELTDAAEPGCVTSTVGAVATSTVGAVATSTVGAVATSTVGAVEALGSNGFALPISTSSFGFLNSLYSAIEALHTLQIY